MRLQTVVSRFPHPAFARGIILRGTFIWLGVRGLLLFVGLTVPHTVTALVIVALTAWLTTLDARRYSETALLANLGVPSWGLFALGAVPAAILETVVRFAT